MSYMLVKLSGGRFNFDRETKFSVLHIVRDTCVDIRESVDLMLLPFTGCYYCHRIIYSSGGWWWRVRAHWTWVFATDNSIMARREPPRAPRRDKTGANSVTSFWSRVWFENIA